jgi:predicted ribosome quality control (RQC) complex YloA/Tae2 family protein
MKEEEIYIRSLLTNIKFYIGENRHDNFDVIDMGMSNDMWFHAKNISSCHVVAEMPDQELSKRELQEILQNGCRLCKENTSKLNGIHNVEFIYTQIKNVRKTKTPGMVTLVESKTMIY